MDTLWLEHGFNVENLDSFGPLDRFICFIRVSLVEHRYDLSMLYKSSYELYYEALELFT